MFEYSKDLTSQNLYRKLLRQERILLDRYKQYMLISASDERGEEAIRELLRMREVIGVSFTNINLEDLRYYLKELKESSFADYTKNKIKGYIRKFLKWNFKDWSERFEEFEDLHFNTQAERKKPITSKDVLTKEEFESLMKAEKSLFWKTFLITQFEGGLRTGEVRKLKWSDIAFED